MHPVRIGTCGWSYKEWAGVFYPDGLPAADWLAYYAEHFPVVEVDNTFYRSPSRRAVEAWRDRTPPGFGFSLKVPQSVTHEKVLLDCRDELAAFLGAARLLGDRLLCCLLQFGYFNRAKFSSLGAFLDRLDPFLASWPALSNLAGLVFLWINRQENYEAYGADATLNPYGLGAAIWSSVISLFIIFLAGRFAVKRLILHPHPPERELKAKKK
jgi:hypothetical protein